MSKVKMHAGDWIIVSDARKALLLENEGDEMFPNLKTREVREHEEEPNRVLNADKPGRVQQSAASFRSAVEPSDRHEEADKNFINALAQRLHELVSSGQTKGLFIVAPAHALGLIRKSSSPAVRSAVRAELDRDLIHLPVYEIEKHLLKWGAEQAS
ncbi:host attachment protein [Methylocapsa acidiphila]|uniref:host attachment protein n=1 Tax=Methylocapsa acidiphila TaxID=133552 RepID=UPI0004048D7C|nr:host attachment protein [Methylocapsa acidiphila]